VIAHILVKTKPLADKLYKQIQNGANFAQLAKKYSQDPGSKNQGGKLTITKGQTVPAFDQAAFTLPTKAISTPIHTQFGYHIIQPLSDVRPAKTTPLKDVKAAIEQQLLQQKKNDAMSKWVTDTKKDFCKGKVAYGKSYVPLTDPCTTLTASTATTSGTTPTP